MARPERPPVLVVDDDDVIAGAIAYCLMDEGYAVLKAANGVEALACAALHTPCLILLDMKMPVLDGWGFAAAYRARPGPHAPIVVMSAAEDAHRRAAEIGADGSLAKPFDLADLLAIVRATAC